MTDWTDDRDDVGRTTCPRCGEPIDQSIAQHLTRAHDADPHVHRTDGHDGQQSLEGWSDE